MFARSLTKIRLGAQCGFKYDGVTVSWHGTYKQFRHVPFMKRRLVLSPSQCVVAPHVGCMHVEQMLPLVRNKSKWNS